MASQPVVPISPFGRTIAQPGYGNVVLSLLPPSIPSLTTLTYQYPLKLLSRTPPFTPETSASTPVHLYLLTYGGGLLPNDHIDVTITLCPRTRLVVTTPQGSTKIFKSGSRESGAAAFRHVVDRASRQSVTVELGRQAALCYLPDPSVPYQSSKYEQVQRFLVDGSVGTPENEDQDLRSSLCVLDWVTQGRAARGENWDFHLWKGKNEVWAQYPDGKKRLLLRDSVILDDEAEQAGDGGDARGREDLQNIIRQRTSPHGVIGTLILYGPVLEPLAAFFVNEFTSQPRIGGRNWSSTAAADRSSLPSANEVTWTAARVRAGFVLVKFGARDFETARDWLGAMLRREGSIGREFGDEALLGL